MVNSHGSGHGEGTLAFNSLGEFVILSSTTPIPATESAEALREFTLWALAMLGCEASSADGVLHQVRLPASLHDYFGNGEEQRLSFVPGIEQPGVQAISLDSAWLRSLLQQLTAERAVVRAEPAHQPASVREISPRLFAAYQVDGGNVHLGGCTLEDRVLLRLSYTEPAPTPTGDARLRHYFVDDSGAPLDEQIVRQLGCDELVPLGRTIRVSDEQCEHWRRVGETCLSAISGAGSRELLLVTAIWCKYAEGKLSFVIGDATAAVAFSGWAALLAEGIQPPPPFHISGEEPGSYHVAATDDGEIVPWEEIGTCAESGRCVRKSQLSICEVTGAMVLPEFLATCPVSQTSVLRRILVPCAACQQMVSPTVLQLNQCEACRSLAPISKSDPRVARVLGEYPRLDRWHRWRLAETAVAYVMLAGGLLQRLLIVVDKETLEVLYLATSSRFSQHWSAASEIDRATYLR